MTQLLVFNFWVSGWKEMTSIHQRWNSKVFDYLGNLWERSENLICLMWQLLSLVSKSTFLCFALCWDTVNIYFCHLVFCWTVPLECARRRLKGCRKNELIISYFVSCVLIICFLPPFLLASRSYFILAAPVHFHAFSSITSWTMEPPQRLQLAPQTLPARSENRSSTSPSKVQSFSSVGTFAKHLHSNGAILSPLFH